MSITARALELFTGGIDDGEFGSALFADLRLWYAWNRDRGTLPTVGDGAAEDASYSDISRRLGLPVVQYLRPWSIKNGDGVTDERVITAEEQRWRFGADDNLLEAVWKIGPDGDFWQTEYPVKTSEDIDTLLNYLEARRYDFRADILESSIEDDALTVVELPSRPFAWLMLEILGWSDGLMLLMDSVEKIEAALSLAGDQVSAITKTICEFREKYLLLSPDNLDAQFISPGFFEMYLSESYRSLTATATDNGHATVVHTGGPIGGLVPLLAETGISGLVGVSEPPQGDAGLSKIRKLSDGRLVPWGGIPQDLLMPTVDEAVAFEGVDAVLTEANECESVVLGVADHIPIEAKAERIMAVSARVRSRK